MKLIFAAAAVAAVALCASCASGHSSVSPMSARAHRPAPSFVASSFPAGFEVVDASNGRIQVRFGIVGTGFGAFATNSAERIAYIERRSSNCSVRVGSFRLVGRAGSTRSTVRTVAAIRGGVIDDVAARPALSPDGRRLAVVVASGPVAAFMGVGRTCLGPSEIVILDLSDGSQRVWTGSTGTNTVESLEWAPDSRRLAYDVSGTVRNPSIDGTHVLDTEARGSSYLRTRLVLPAASRNGSDDPGSGPVFWWHGSKVVVEDGALMVVHHQRLVAPRALHPPVGLPADVRTVSVAADRTDLLLQDGDGETWWWDGSISRQVPDPPGRRWSEPIW
jgi:hypothetical protein